MRVGAEDSVGRMVRGDAETGKVPHATAHRHATDRAVIATIATAVAAAKILALSRGR